MDWIKLKKFYEDPKLIDGQTLRNYECQTQYEKHKEYLSFNKISVMEYIISTYFTEDRDWVIVPNNYPYDLKNDIKHYLIWINPTKNLKHEEIAAIIEKYMHENKFAEYVYYKNPEIMQSVPGICHYHIFIKN